MKYKDINEAKMNIRKIVAAIAGNIDVTQVMYEAVQDYFPDYETAEEAENLGLYPLLKKQLIKELR